MAGRAKSGDLVLGRFRIEAPLGRGSAGPSFKARDLETDRLVVVKELPSDRKDLFERFQGEVGLIKDLGGDFADGDGILKLVVPLAIGLHGEHPVAVREYLEGTSLRDRMKKGAMPEDEIRSALGGVARALAAAHRENLVLRNLKPENVFLEPGGRVRVTGVGTGCFLTRARRESLGVELGALRYVAPEQVLDARRIDRSTDLFALGLLLYEALSGAPAIEAGSLEAVLAKVVEPLALKTPPGSPALAELALRLTRFESGERPSRVEPVVAELTPWAPVGEAAGRCEGCSTPVAAGAAFCTHCGRATTGPCPHCGKAPGLKSTFCSRCGQPCRGPGRAQLLSLNGRFKGQVVPLPEEGELTLGRAPQCGLSFEERDQYVSRHQGRIQVRRRRRWIEGGDWVTGRPTTNGTLLNGKNLDGLGQVLLRSGDRLRVGDSFFCYQEKGE